MGKHKRRMHGEKNKFMSPQPKPAFPSPQTMQEGIMGGRQFSGTARNKNAPLPNMKCRELMGILHTIGYEVSRKKGSHIQLRADGLPPVTVPNHTEIATGTLRKIISQIGMSKEQFVAVYQKCA